HAFAPLPDQRQWSAGLLTNHRVKSSDSLRDLVKLGPDALPFLLHALEDKRPTKLKVTHKLAIGFMGFGTELPRNPLHPVEKPVLSKPWAADDDEEGGLLDSYTVKVGDLCF